MLYIKSVFAITSIAKDESNKYKDTFTLLIKAEKVINGMIKHPSASGNI